MPKAKRIRFKLERDGSISWLEAPESFIAPLVSNRSRRRFSEITPTNPLLFVLFRLIRLVFGEGKWCIPEWTRNWQCEWKATILIGESKGMSETSTDRSYLISWEHEQHFKPHCNL